MKTFTDTAGREWTIELTVASVKRVRSLLDVDLLSLQAGKPPLIARLGSDVCLLCDVLFALVKPQADERSVSDEQFGASLGGSAILHGLEGLYAELIDFFRQLGRTELAVAVERQREIIRLATSAAETRIRQIDLAKEVETTMDEAMRQAEADAGESEPGNASTASPGGSA